jgi:predicted ABC-type ATPase
MHDRPSIVVIGGPNGAGQTTISKAVLADTLGIRHFVNADTIAQGLCGFAPERASFAAGRLMLRRLHELAEARESFAFESTLASRTFAPWLRQQSAHGYSISLVYVCLRSAALAVRRVRHRVRLGGHDVPAETVHRRFVRSAHNLFHLYLPLAHSWTIYDNSSSGPARLVARRSACTPPTVLDRRLWNHLRGLSGDTERELSEAD